MEPIVLRNTGWIELIWGGMFSGKTTEMLARIEKAQRARKIVTIYKPSIDTRASKKSLVTMHSGETVEAINIKDPREILTHAHICNIVGIDEIQFFDREIIEVCQKLANRGKRVIVTGLDMNYMGEPFSITMRLAAIAEFIDKVHAVCTQCGNMANHSNIKIDPEGEIVVIGGKEKYEALCRKCFCG